MNYIRNNIYNPFSKRSTSKESSFKQQLSLEKRQLLYEKIMLDYQDKFPIILHGIDPERSKFLANSTMTVEDVIVAIKKYTHSTKSISLQTNNGVDLILADSMVQVYDKYKDSEDKFLYLWLIGFE